MLAKEAAAWQGFFRYFKERKEEIDAETSRIGKITRGEIEDVFEKFVAKHYKKIIIRQNMIFYSTQFFNPNQRDSENRTNLERMNLGLVPIGPDNKSMNVHHLTRQQPGYFVLLSDQLHKEKSQDLHFRDSKYHTQPEALSRKVFNTLRTKVLIPAIVEKLE